MSTAILLISSPDQKGITAAVTNFIYQNNGNIEHADQHIDSNLNIFFMRIEWSLEDFSIPPSKLKTAFKPLADKFSMDWSLHFSGEKEKMAIFVSNKYHCLYDLLHKYKQGYLRCKIPLIISNHRQTKPIADYFNIPFFYSFKNSKSKKKAEAKEISLLKKEKIDSIVLARYMQIFGKNFVDNFRNKVINIHHSFLPAFAGKNPYRQAYRRGVKIIGATSHYVTEKLDKGPIIQQGTTGISHRDSLLDLKHKGQDLEKSVLSRAVQLHLDKKILVYKNKTVVFD
ncbi:MAG: formyltetrahydrofolate deformylase [Candidatus Omnitrophica bacterium]|nr:formyltetrahydrofolate deformylase [Candidatus Omnitrophota bacterium]MCF7877752.1 formyltetrahydrofolate deformylase [Candidatus Omnitrophota bacterium]MCF7878058.1 formyltetrahydrofolate deformylase [Candidatus Omnitrophota bacterium]MCF7892739.1 formyltetrahydrofolate deformylase [Candidatus Omnitrophota bacterium]